MVRLVSLGVFATCAQVSAYPRDRSLFIGPFYQLNEDQIEQNGFDDVSGRFREAYCIARHQGDREDTTTVFNTVVATPDGPRHPQYYTREEFTDGASFNGHLDNVSDAFANARGVSDPAGFFAFGLQDDLNTIHDNVVKNNMTTFVKDRRSFKQLQFKGDDYFSVDFFLDVPRQNLESFITAWHGACDAAFEHGVWAFAMGIHENADGSYKAVSQETYASAAAYLDWLPIAHPHVGAILETGTVSETPNPFTMSGSAEQLATVADTCNGLPFTCIQYTFDTCEGVGVDVVV